MVTRLPFALAATLRRRSRWARFWSYCPKTREASRLSSKVRVISAVSSTPGGKLAGTRIFGPRVVTLSAGLKSPLRVSCRVEGGRPRALAEQAVRAGPDDPHRNDLADPILALQLDGLQVGRLARQLAGMATRFLKENVD